MQNFEKFAAALNDRVLSVHKCSPDITADSPIEFLDGQQHLCSGTIYLGRPAQAVSVFNRAVVEPCCVILVCETKKTVLGDIPAAESCTYLETSATLGRVYNLLRQQASGWQHDEDSELALLGKGGVDLGRLWRYILTHKYFPADQVKYFLSQSVPGIGDNTFIRVLLVDCRTAQNPLDTMDRIGLAILHDNPSASLIPYSGMLVALLCETKRSINPDIDMQALEAVLREQNVYAAVSYSTRDFSKLRTLFLITKRIVYIAPRLELEPGKHLFCHDRYAAYYVLDLCAQRYVQLHGHSDIVYLVHPAVIQLTRYDTEHNTGLRDLLFYYLLNNGNLAKTAADTHMHRNTVINRMKKLQSLVPLDLEDGELCQRLIFACQVVRYREQIMKMQVLRDLSGKQDSPD